MLGVSSHAGPPRTLGRQLSFQKLSGRELGSAILLSHQPLLLPRDQAGRGLSVLAKWLSARGQESRGIRARREGCRSPAVSHPVAATVAAQIHREDPLPHSRQISRPIYLPSETPAQGQHHKSRGGSEQASKPTTPWRASFLPGPSRSALGWHGSLHGA